MVKKSIVFFTENLYGGGVERIQQTILKHFDYKLYRVTLISNRKEQMDLSLYPEEIHNNYRWVFESVSESDSLLIQFLKKVVNKLKLYVYYHFSPTFFYRLFIRERYDVGIAFIEGYSTRLLSGAPSSTKKIAWVHIELENYHWSKVAFRDFEEELSCYKQMDRVVCVSETVKDQFQRLFHKEATVMYNPIDTETIIRLSKDIPEMPQKSHEYRLVALGSLTKRKGFDRLIRAVNSLLCSHYSIELYILGKGEEEDQLLKLIKDLGLEAYVFLLGYKENPYCYMKNSDIYICSSFAEGYNTAITEAMVLGLPVVSTLCSGVLEQLGDSQYGIVTSNTEDGLRVGIERMLNQDAINHFSEMSASRGEHYSLESSMSVLYQLL